MAEASQMAYGGTRGMSFNSSQQSLSSSQIVVVKESHGGQDMTQEWDSHVDGSVSGGVSHGETLAVVTRRQAEWDRQLEDLDAKASQTSQTQWKILREQVNSLSRETASVQQKMREMRYDSRLVELERRQLEGDEKTQQQWTMISSVQEEAEKSCKRVRHEIELKLEQRSQIDAEMQGSISSMSMQFEVRGRELSVIDSSVKKLQSDASVVALRCDDFKDGLSAEASERVTQQDRLQLEQRGAAEALRKEVRSRTDVTDRLEQSVKETADTMEQEKTERRAEDSAQKAQSQTMARELSALQKEVAALRQEQESLAKHEEVNDLRKSLERETAARTTESMRVDKRFLEMTATLEKDKLARSSWEEEFQLAQMAQSQALDQQKDSLSKLRASVDELKNALKAAQDSLESSIINATEGERRAREADKESIRAEFVAKVAAQRSLHDALAQKVESSATKEDLSRFEKDIKEFAERVRKLQDDVVLRAKDSEVKDSFSRERSYMEEKLEQLSGTVEEQRASLTTQSEKLFKRLGDQEFKQRDDITAEIKTRGESVQRLDQDLRSLLEKLRGC